MTDDTAKSEPWVAARGALDLGPVGEWAETAEGVRTVRRYGEVETEHERLRRGCGLLDRLWVEHLELKGEDRGRFVNGMITADARSLRPGDGRFVFFTSGQGKILAEARLLALSESLLLELPAGRAAPIAEHLRRYVVADRVTLEPRPELRALTLVGPDAWRVAARLAADEPEPVESWSSRQVMWNGARVVLARDERLGGPAVTLHVERGEASATAERLLQEIDGLAAVPVGFAAAEALRIEAGWSRFGADYGSDRFPQEVGESDALDFEKGCYLGQEVVARIHYRGKVNHRLCGLRLGDGELPPSGSAVLLDREEVGRTGSAERSPALGEGIALTLLHRRAEIGAIVDVGGRGARVVELPFVVR